MSTMNSPLIPLLQREWLQHRLAWALMGAIPLLLGLLLTGLGSIDFGDDTPSAGLLPTMLALGAIGGTTAVVFIVAWTSALIVSAGLARRDHADRSVEFWLSMPVDHAPSLAVPLLVHLLLVPALALAVGLLGGYLISLVLVTRLLGFEAWLSLPWAALIVATLAGAARLAAGLVLATLWLSPLFLLLVLCNAWFKRWGLPIVVLGLGLGGVVLQQLFGQPLLMDLLRALFGNAVRAVIHGGDDSGVVVTEGSDPAQLLGLAPAWAWEDLQLALAALASPLLAGALLAAAGCFWLLVEWRRRGASLAA